MAAADTTFTIFLKTIADAAGITQIKDSVGELETRLQTFAATARSALESVGVGLSLSALNSAGDAALKNREAFAAWEVQILSSKEGSAQLIDELGKFNKELEATTGTSEKSS